MSVTSADPAALGEFTDGVRAARSSVASEQRSVATLQSSVHAGSSDYRVDVPAIGALATLLGSMAGNQAFVATVRRELVAADRHGTGQVTVGDPVIAGALDARGVASPPETLEFEPATMVGKPPTSGFVDDPVCAANGNMVHHDTDLVFPGIAAALDVHRTYNSIVADRVGAFGPGWTSILDVRLDTSGAGEPGRVEVHLPDGAIAGFVRRDDRFVPTSRRVHSIAATPTGWTVWWDHRRTFEFDQRGVLIGWSVGAARVLVERDHLGRFASAIESLSGRSWGVVWSAGGHVDQLVAHDGRRVSYDRGDDGSPRRVSSASGHLDYHWSGTLLTSVVDADGVAAFVNEYDDERRVVVQTSPFGRVTSYRYEIPGATVITDERGVRQAMVHDARGNLTAVVDTR